MKASHMVDLLIVGASGHACVVAEAAVASYRISGFVDDRADGREVADYGPFLGNPDVIGNWMEVQKQGAVHVAIGDNGARRKVVDALCRKYPGIRFAAVIHPNACVSRTALVGDGALICAGAVVSAKALIGSHCILNTRSVLDHHASMGGFASLAPTAATGGRVTIGSGTAIGMGSMIHHGIGVGEDTVVGSLSLVTRDLPSRVVAYGHPCRVVRQREPGDKYL
jgi:sugar O-acyltransferase (sialic acid O-acetyltransferase NeuD family)